MSCDKPPCYDDAVKTPHSLEGKLKLYSKNNLNPKFPSRKLKNLYQLIPMHYDEWQHPCSTQYQGTLMKQHITIHYVIAVV